MSSENVNAASSSGDITTGAGGVSRQEAANDHHPGRLAYFQPGEITLQVEHGDDVSEEQMTAWVRNLWNTVREQYPNPSPELASCLSSIQEISPRSGIKFKNGNGLVQSLLHVPLPPLNLQSDDVKKAARNDSAIIEAVNSLNANACTVINGMTLRAAAPPWLFFGALHALTHGGPGGLPVVVPGGNPSQNKYGFHKGAIDKIIGKPGVNAGKQVKVVIFDTAPPRETSGEELQAHTLADSFTAFATHPILQPLRGKLTVKYAQDLGIPLPPTVRQDPVHHFSHRDEYNASDHGLFIAGIVHDFAPEADIYLVEVLNQDAVGTLETLADGLRALGEGRIFPLDQFSKENGALVVNCSLCMDCPPPNERGEIVLRHEDGRGKEIAPPSILTSPDQVFAPLRAALAAFYQAFDGYDVQIVAAAGNDGPENGKPPPASYPAAFPSVLGVGAMESTIKRAGYSNLADDPPYAGVVVFGGKGNARESTSASVIPPKKWNETDGARGMLGVYVGGFPGVIEATGEIVAPAQASPNGWGRWSGTSFATGVVSGILARAAVNGCPISLKTPGNFYRKLHAHRSTRRTRFGEVIIYAPQGPLPHILVRLYWWILDLFGRLPQP